MDSMTSIHRMKVNNVFGYSREGHSRITGRLDSTGEIIMLKDSVRIIYSTKSNPDRIFQTYPNEIFGTVELIKDHYVIVEKYAGKITFKLDEIDSQMITIIDRFKG